MKLLTLVLLLAIALSGKAQLRLRFHQAPTQPPLQVDLDKVYCVFMTETDNVKLYKYENKLTCSPGYQVLFDKKNYLIKIRKNIKGKFRNILTIYFQDKTIYKRI